LNSSDSPSEPPGSTELPKKSGTSPDKTKERKKKWTLNKKAFDQLLNCFSSDRDAAAVQYDLGYRKVVRYFEWRGIVRAEACADETMDRVARRITEGKQIDKLMAYIFGVAHHVFQEVLDEEKRATALEDAPAEYLRQDPTEPVDPDARLICFDRCLGELGAENQKLVLGYYEGEGREKIDNRLKLARELKIPLNALRIRVHRIKRTLEDCIAECLKTAAARNN
jgi:DNA-directed RNA polymerase specialized sigma24 family protein